MNFKKNILIQCIIALISFPVVSFCGPIQTGSWSTSSGDVKFYISQQSELDTLRVKLTFSGSCSGSMTKSSYGISIIDRSFSLNLGSTFDNSTGTLTGAFSEDGASCSGTYKFAKSPCDPINVSWTATLVDPGESNAVDIVDVNLLNALLELGVDANSDGAISYSEAEVVSSLDVSSREISDMTGIEAFINLESLYCQSNQLTSLDVTKTTLLAKLWCAKNLLTSLDVSNNIALYDLWCSSNLLTSLDVSNNTSLIELWCEENLLTSLDVSNNTLITDLICFDNQLTSLDVSNNTSLKELWCEENLLTSLDVSKIISLEILSCWNNQLTSLDVTNNASLKILSCRNNQLTSLDVSSNLVLEQLWCSINQITSLDVSSNLVLEQLWCRSNQFTNLDVSNNPALTDLGCSYNPIATLDVSANRALTRLWCVDNKLSSLDVSNNPYLVSLLCCTNQLTSLDVSSNLVLEQLWCGDNLITNLDISINKAIGSAESELDALEISNMPSLYEVCVWTMPFPPPGVNINTSSSPNVSFTTECSGSVGNNIEELSQLRLSIYPNPAMNILTIETDNSDHYSIEITSLNGQQLFNGSMEGTSYQIDLSPFQKGIYLITIRSKDFVTTKKIIKL